MEALCDEIIQLIFIDLDDPSALARTSRRFYGFSKVAYVRAQYFLARYGTHEALYGAFGRGRVVTEEVLDIMLSSGARTSRYFCQVAMHHYFHTTPHFIKTPWVRVLPLNVFAHFLKICAKQYGEIPRTKGTDDGTIFSTFLKEGKVPSDKKTVGWEDIKELLEVYHFIPFCVKDPIMIQFPLALAIEPRLLPLAKANGFRMDRKYRDFVFRKIFEKPSVTYEGRVDEIIHNVQELQRLDSTMFLSRTVAAEICLEAKSNESAYTALKRLDKAGHFLFELAPLVEDLIKMFLNTRSITGTSLGQAFRQLYTDFPTNDPTVRAVLIVNAFATDGAAQGATATSLRAALHQYGLTPLSRRDIVNVLVNPFVEKANLAIAYAQTELKLDTKGRQLLVEEVAARCLEVGCKGKALQRLFDAHPNLHHSIERYVQERHSVNLDDLPEHTDSEGCIAFRAKLCRLISSNSDEGLLNFEDGRDFPPQASSSDTQLPDLRPDDEDEDEEMADFEEVGHADIIQPNDHADGKGQDLGEIGHDTLSAMIRRDELAPARGRNRYYARYLLERDAFGKLPYPSEYLQVGLWIKREYGSRSVVTAHFMTHAIVNNNLQVISHYLSGPLANMVPITLKHFQILSRLGKAPAARMWEVIGMGLRLCQDESEYASDPDTTKTYKIQVKNEPSSSPFGSVEAPSSPPRSPPPRAPSPPSPRGKKRPRRTVAATVATYAIPDSDDEDIMDVNEGPIHVYKPEHKRGADDKTELQRWIKALSALLKDEQAKHKERKKRAAKENPLDIKLRVHKSDFFRSLGSNLRKLKKLDFETRIADGHESDEAVFTDDGDDDYAYRSGRGKRRRPTY